MDWDRRATRRTRSLVAARVSYMAATGIAVEAALLHNFIWHERFTWPDRREGGRHGGFGRLWRFHLGNGLISLAGNLLLMRVLVGVFGVPVILSNVVAVAACWLANFLASDRWVFMDSRPMNSAPALATASAGRKAHR